MLGLIGVAIASGRGESGAPALTTRPAQAGLTVPESVPPPSAEVLAEMTRREGTPRRVTTHILPVPSSTSYAPVPSAP